MNRIIWIAGTLLLSGAGAAAQVMDHATMDHSAAVGHSQAAPAGVPTEAGQSAYAAIGEVARIMLANPQTDWSHADVDALRNHLVDMDNVTLRATVTQTKV